jgi:hypothetical protein
LAFELFEDSYDKAGTWRAALGLLIGAIVFTLIASASTGWLRDTSRRMTAARSWTSTRRVSKRRLPRRRRRAPPD